MSKHPHDTFELPDGRRIRVLGPNIFVKMDPVDTKRGLIHFAPSAMDHVNRTGTVIAFGTYEITKGPKRGTRIPIPEVNVGDKVLFIRFLAEQDSNKYIRHQFGNDIIRIRPADIAVSYSADETHEFA